MKTVLATSLFAAFLTLALILSGSTPSFADFVGITFAALLAGWFFGTPERKIRSLQTDTALRPTLLDRSAKPDRPPLRKAA